MADGRFKIFPVLGKKARSKRSKRTQRQRDQRQPDASASSCHLKKDKKGFFITANGMQAWFRWPKNVRTEGVRRTCVGRTELAATGGFVTQRQRRPTSRASLDRCGALRQGSPSGSSLTERKLAPQTADWPDDPDVVAESSASRSRATNKRAPAATLEVWRDDAHRSASVAMFGSKVKASSHQSRRWPAPTGVPTRTSRHSSQPDPVSFVVWSGGWVRDAP